MQLKKGDKIKFIRNHEPYWKKGDVRIIKWYERSQCLYIPYDNINDKDGYVLTAFSDKDIILYKEIKTEVDWLDAIQENFKDG